MQVANDDYILWQSFKSGNRASFETIYFSYFNNLYEYGMRLVSDRELVKDAIHDLFLKLWSNKSNLGDIYAIRSYLLVSLRGTIHNKLQGNRIKLTGVDDANHFEMVFSVESDYIKKETKSEQAQQLIDAFNQLTDRQKEAIYLRYFEELEYEEIAIIMDITVKATYKLTARGLEALRNIMNLPNSSLVLLFALTRSEVF